MTDRPILFSAPMVRALIDGRKTQTRRAFSSLRGRQCRHISEFGRSDTLGFDWHFRDDGKRWHDLRHAELLPRLKYRTSDRLWVKEIWRPFSIDLAPWDIEVAYAADGERRIINDGEFGDNDWTIPKAAERGNVSPLFMPRWASRLTLTVTDVRVERLQDISEDDAVAEGCFKGKASGRIFANESAMHLGGDEWANARDWYADLWEEINGAGAWEANPWVAAYTFTVHRGNIDERGSADDA